MRIFLIFITGALILSEALAQEPQTYIYVESNIGTVPDQNSVFAFANDGLGNLVGLPGSPYLTDGTGVHARGSEELNADQEVIANKAGTALYAVNGHTNSTAAFRVKCRWNTNSYRRVSFSFRRSRSGKPWFVRQVFGRGKQELRS